MTKEQIDFVLGCLLGLVGMILGGSIVTYIWKEKKKQIFLTIIFLYLTIITGAFLIKFVKLIWLSYSLPVFFVLILLWISFRNLRITSLMVSLIKEHKYLEAIRIGEKEIKRGNNNFGVKINLAIAYYYNKNIDKALSVIESIDLSKLSSSERKLLNEWRIKIKESLKNKLNA